METIKDIIQDMRVFADIYPRTVGKDFVKMRKSLECFADRIEKVVINCNQLKMRKALENIKECYENDYLSLDRDPGDVLCNAALLAENALSAPPRNCDIGSAAEQYKRWNNFCLKIKSCADCKLNGDGSYAKCFLKFLRMPYKKDEAKGDAE